MDESEAKGRFTIRLNRTKAHIQLRSSNAKGSLAYKLLHVKRPFSNCGGATVSLFLCKAFTPKTLARSCCTNRNIIPYSRTWWLLILFCLSAFQMLDSRMSSRWKNKTKTLLFRWKLFVPGWLFPRSTSILLINDEILAHVEYITKIWNVAVTLLFAVKKLRM